MEYILISLISAAILFVSCTSAQVEKLSIVKKIILIGYLFAMFLLFSDLGQLMAVVVVAGALLFIVLFAENRMISFLCGMIGYMGNAVLNYVVLLVLYRFFSIDLQKIQNEYAVVFLLCYLCLTYLFMRIIRWLLKDKVQIEELQVSGKVSFLLAANLSLCAGIYIVNFAFAEKNMYSLVMIGANTLLFGVYFIINLLVLLLVIKTVQTEKSKENKLQHLESLQQYTNNLEQLYRELRGFKHDYKNMMLTAGHYLREGNIEGLKRFLEQKSPELSVEVDEKIYDFSDLQQIQQQGVRSILHNKLLLAMMNDIDVELMVSSVIDIQNISEVDLCRILGIYLDNAIEAALETDKPSIHVSITGIAGISIKVGNSCKKEGICVSRLSEFGYSTKGENRGVGLYTVVKVFAKYPEICSETYVKEQQFFQVLENL